MRYIIYGAGAIGGVIGSRLLQSGHDVVLIARGDHLNAIRQRGLRLITSADMLTQSIPAVAHPSEIRFGADDVVFLTTKTQDTAAALLELDAASNGKELPIICAQNGVENERLASRRYARVYAMMVWMPATFVEPGEVRCYGSPRNGILDLGLFPRGVDNLARTVARALEKSNFSSRAVSDIMRWKYTKLLSNLRAAVNVLSGTDADKSELIVKIRAEALACYRAANIDFASPDEDSHRRETSEVSIAEIQDGPRSGSSLWQSLARKTGSVETNYVNGEIVLLGALHNIDVRYNRAAVIWANRMARGHHPPETLSVIDQRGLLEQQ